MQLLSNTVSVSPCQFSKFTFGEHKPTWVGEWVEPLCKGV